MVQKAPEQGSLTIRQRLLAVALIVNYGACLFHTVYRDRQHNGDDSDVPLLIVLAVAIVVLLHDVFPWKRRQRYPTSPPL